MKTKNFASWIAIVAVAAIIFTGCQKELSQPLNQNPASSDLIAADVNALTVQADNDFLNAEITGGTETEAFALTNDGLPDAYSVTEATANEFNSAKRDGDGAGIRKCLQNLDLSAEQVAKIRHLFKEYDACNNSIVLRYRNAVQELLIKYNGRHEELVKALRNGKITKAQFEEKVKELRKLFTSERDELATKARAALKECYTHMLRGLNHILTEKQWKAFIACYQH